MIRRWILGTAVAVMAVMPASGYAQTPSGDKAKDDATKMEKMEKKHDKMMDGKHDKMKGKMMEKKDDKMDKMDKMEKK
jgi:uncharacterized protein involved in copper resistance